MYTNRTSKAFLDKQNNKQLPQSMGMFRHEGLLRWESSLSADFVLPKLGYFSPMPATSGAGVFSFTAIVVVAPQRNSKRQPDIFTISQSVRLPATFSSSARLMKERIISKTTPNMVARARTHMHEFCTQRGASQRTESASRTNSELPHRPRVARHLVYVVPKRVSWSQDPGETKIYVG